MSEENYLELLNSGKNAKRSYDQKQDGIRAENEKLRKEKEEREEKERKEKEERETREKEEAEEKRRIASGGDIKKLEFVRDQVNDMRINSEFDSVISLKAMGKVIIVLTEAIKDLA